MPCREKAGTHADQTAGWCHACKEEPAHARQLQRQHAQFACPAGTSCSTLHAKELVTCLDAEQGLHCSRGGAGSPAPGPGWPPLQC